MATFTSGLQASAGSRVNSVLRDLRVAMARRDPYADPEHWLSNLLDMSAGSEGWLHSPAEVSHAIRVLERLCD